MRVCVFSGSRAEFGLLAPLIECLQNSKTIELKLLVSGSHLSDYHGYTKTEILQRGLKIDFEVPMNLSERDNASRYNQSVFVFDRKIFLMHFKNLILIC